MTFIRLGYVAMSMNVKNSSPSQTMTHAQFMKIRDREAAVRKLERIAISNLTNCLRLLRHNAAHDIEFFRLSSKLIPLANHPDLPHWNYIAPLREILGSIQTFLNEHPNMRIDFHPDHFNVLNTKDNDAFKMALKTLSMHYSLLKGMGIPPEYRCVLHVGGGYNDKEKALEQFISNWAMIPVPIQKMTMLENDDTTFTFREALYLCEKLGVPMVFDYHHHLAHHEEGAKWEEDWPRAVHTWKNADLPIKMHISSPKSEKDFKAHADFIEVKGFMEFLQTVKGTVPQIDVMIEAKQKDNALFALMEELKKEPSVEIASGASFYVK
ncbi:MAG TPA: UV DNA damage repair endonuclease UvsE [Chondromyces sp.]|nr:UV DNA damage repair endonuclease UvsE [Chondromyces sp.]